MMATAPAPTLREQVLEVLRRQLSTMSAMAVLRTAEQRAGLDPGALTPSDLPRLLDALQARLPMFIVDSCELARCISALEAALGSERGAAGSQRNDDVVRLEVASEPDIVAVRTLGRQVCQNLGFSAADQVKITTVISELARNIVQYAKRGTIEIHRLGVPQLGIEIVARDNGPGIANLDAVLAGRYRSKLGMGMGLRGTKSLMDEMHVRTGLGVGTTVRTRKYRR